MIYSILLLSFVAGIGIHDLWQRRHAFFSGKGGRIQLPHSPSHYDRLDLSNPLDQESEEEAGSSGRSSKEPSFIQRWRSSIRSLVHGTRGVSLSSDDNDDNRMDRQTHSGASSSNIQDSDSNTNSFSRQRLGRGAHLITPDVLAAYSQPRTYRLNTVLSNAFYNLGLVCSSSPWITLLLGLTVCGVLNAGWSRFKVEKDPVRLWVPHDSELAKQKELFDTQFGPFYRTEQIFLSRAKPAQADHTRSAVLDWATIQWWAGVEQEIRTLMSPAGTTLKDVCFAPMAEDESSKAVQDCTVQSFMGYWQDSLNKVTAENWSDKLDACATNPTACLSSAGQPLNPRLLFGGVPGYSGIRDKPLEDVPASAAEAIVVTYVVDNSLDGQKIQKTEEWEDALKRYLQELSITAKESHGVQLSFSTGVSLERELNKSTNTDVPIVVLSYLVMFFYVSVSLGGTGTGIVTLLWALLSAAFGAITQRSGSGPIALDQSHERLATSSSTASMRSTSAGTSVTFALRKLLVDSKFLLGLLGIAIVLLSVSTSVGLFSFFGVRVTLIIAEVIPFLVLAIGVDNVFLLAHELERQNARAYNSLPRPSSADDHFDPSELPTAEERVSRALGRMGPSILLSSTCQTVAFGLGATVAMPAVRNFAIYAAGAVAVNALLQITVFVAAMTIDLKRIEVCFRCTQFHEAGSR